MRYAMALIGATLLAGTASAQTVSNGSFENGSYSGSPNGFFLYGDGSTAITGWTVTSDHRDGNIAVAGNGSGYGITASNGQFSLDLTGGSNTSQTDSYGNGVSQQFATIAGHSYSLSFDVGTHNGYTTGIASIEVFLNGASLFTGMNDFIDPASGAQNWAINTTSFTAAGDSTTLGFVSRSGGNYDGLDHVQVTDLTPDLPSAVPEAASWAMMIVGLGAIGTSLRRRSRVSARVAIA